MKSLNVDCRSFAYQRLKLFVKSQLTVYLKCVQHLKFHFV